MQSRLQVERGAVTSVFMRWGFDPMFSDSIRGEFDKNRDRKFDKAETAALVAGAFVNLRQYGFLTHLTADGRPVPLGEFRDFSARMEKDALVYEFVLPLPSPASLSRPLKLAVYDETYFIDVGFSARSPVTFAGGESSCKAEVGEDETNTIYYGMVNPVAATITCGSR